MDPCYQKLVKKKENVWILLAIDVAIFGSFCTLSSMFLTVVLFYLIL